MTANLPPVTRWDDVADPAAAVIVVHGMAEHPGRYERFARALNGARLVVWAPHLRGHGVNPVPGIRGHFADRNGWTALAADVRAVAEALAAARPGLPLIMFAHSMGSFLALRVLAEHGEAFAACVLSGTNGPPDFRERLARRLARLQVAVHGGRAPGTWLQTLVIEHNYNRSFGAAAPPNTWLSCDEAEVERYNRDPLCGFPLSCQAWLDLLDARASQGRVEFLRAIPTRLPIHVIAGACDPVGARGAGVRRLLRAFAGAGVTTVSSRFYEGARHELLNELNRDEVTRDLILWIAQVLKLPGLGR